MTDRKDADQESAPLKVRVQEGVTRNSAPLTNSDWQRRLQSIRDALSDDANALAEDARRVFGNDRGRRR